MIGVPDFVENAAEGLKNAGEAVLETGQQVVEAGTAVVGTAAHGFREVLGVFDIGEPGGDDGGSSNWAAWGHEEIRSMLDNTVDPADIDEGAQAWRWLRESATRIITDSTTEQRQIVSNGWRGESAEAAIGSLTPVDEWADTLGTRMDDTSQLMGTSGYYAGEAKATVPPPQPHNWGQSLHSFARDGALGAGIDAVAQDRAQEEARAQAVRIMSNVYSAPINENRSALPIYPQPPDPTLQPPDPSMVGGPSPGAGSGGSVIPGGGGGGGAPVGGVPDGGVPHQPPASSGLQNLPGGSGGTETPGQVAGPRPPIGDPGGGGAGGRSLGSAAPPAAAGAPFVPPIGTGGAGAGDARRGFRGAGGLGGARAGGLGGLGGRAGSGAGGGPGFGPRGPGSSAASAAEGGRMGAGPGGGAGAGVGGGAAGRGGVGGVPLAGAGAGRGQGGEDDEHRRPSYLIDTDDIFGDGRKVAPPVIGENPPEHYR